MAAWQAVTSSVKAQGGSIVLQIMHAGRITHPLNQHGVSISVAPSAIRAQGEMYTDQRGLLPFTTPHALSTAEVPTVVQEFVNCAQAAMKAGFDGVELHGANGEHAGRTACCLAVLRLRQRCPATYPHADGARADRPSAPQAI